MRALAVWIANVIAIVAGLWCVAEIWRLPHFSFTCVACHSLVSVSSQPSSAAASALRWWLHPGALRGHSRPRRSARVVVVMAEWGFCNPLLSFDVRPAVIAVLTLLQKRPRGRTRDSAARSSRLRVVCHSLTQCVLIVRIRYGWCCVGPSAWMARTSARMG